VPRRSIRLTAAAVLVCAITVMHFIPGREVSAASTLPAAVEGALRDDLAARATVGGTAINLVRVEAVTWRNGCLGVARPEASCLLEVVDGYVAWATANGAGFRYHTDLESTVVLAEGSIAPSTIAGAGLPEDVIATPETRGTLVSGSIPAEGFGLVVFGGGNYRDLVAATGCAAEDARFWATVDGRFLVLVPATTVGAVNAAFDAAFFGAIASGTPLIGTCPAAEVPSDGPPRLTATAARRSGPLGLGSYCWPFEPVEQQLCEDAGLTTTAQLLTMQNGESITVGGVPRGVRSVEATVFPHPGGTGLQEGANRISWVAAGPTTELSATVVGSRLLLAQSLPSGRYLLSLNIDWGSGDAVFGAAYGLQFDVE